MRRITFVVGVSLIALGFAALVLPETIHVSQPDVVITVAGLGALLAAAIIAHRGYSEPRRETDPPAVEQPDHIPGAGDDVNELLRYASPPYDYVRERRKLRDRTYDLAVTVHETFDGLSGEEADEVLSTGSWTDDEFAAAFLGAFPTDRRLTERLQYRVFGPRSIRTQFDRALTAIAERTPGWEGFEPIEDKRSKLTLAAPRAGVRIPTGNITETGHWRGISVVALIAIGTGVMTELASIVFAGVVGICYVAYARTGAPPTIDLALDRSITPDDPDPGDPVTVTVTVENRGQTLVDLRLIDGVPGPLTVESGTARRSTLLRSGATTNISYTVTAVQGTHTWKPLLAIARSLNGTYECRKEIESETTLQATPVSQELSEPIPLRTDGSIAVGQLPSQRPGEGIEFQSVREYRPGDRRSRIDWRRYARYGDLTTVEFREERSTTVLITVDARTEAYLTPESGAPHVVEIGTGVADQLAVSLLAAGHRVGFASIAPDPCWLPPRAERIQRARIAELLATHHSIDHQPPAGNVSAFMWVNWLRSRIQGDAQLLLVSPLCDDLIVHLIVRIEALGYPVTVISPDPTGQNSLGARMTGLERTVRIAKLRRRGVTVIDWDIDDPLDAQITRRAGRKPS